MDSKRITGWLNSIQGWLDPPGCEETYASFPANKRSSCPVGIVHEHRFAFFFWGLYAQDQNERHPVLITIDSHDDVGVPGEVIPNDLDNLNIRNRTELALFVWTRLRSLNDGHILPALYLNFFSDAYVLMNDGEDYDEIRSSGNEQRHKDREGHLHRVKFYRDVEHLLGDLPQNGPVFLDIDLDFFALESREAGARVGSETLKSDDDIRLLLSIEGPFMGALMNRIVGLTIALEPNYCGGLCNSLHVLDILNHEFFGGTLCMDSCKWKRRANIGVQRTRKAWRRHRPLKL
jgi:hypothetical protein